jgi:hypothetical protein
MNEMRVLGNTAAPSLKCFRFIFRLLCSTAASEPFWRTILPHLWISHPLLPLTVVPTKTTCTAANAVVAAKQSTLLACAKTVSAMLKSREKATIAAIRASGCGMKYRAKMHMAGRREETMVLIALTVAASLPSEYWVTGSCTDASAREIGSRRRWPILL